MFKIPLLLIDLDDTLANTEQFKFELFKYMATQSGISIDVVREQYLKGKSFEDFQVFKQPMLDIMHTLQTNDRIVEYLRNFDGHKVLFTFGDRDVQRAKIDVLLLQDLLDDIIITQKRKTEALAELVQETNIVIQGKEYTDITLVDDNKELLTYARTHFPWMIVVDSADLV